MKYIARVILFFLIFLIWSTKYTFAANIYTPTGGLLVTGTETATSASNTGSWKGSIGTDNNAWITARNASSGLDKQIYVDNVQENGANKLIITIEDANITTATNYSHQICDWVSSTSVDVAADANCTGGGWRDLHPRKTAYTNTADTSRVYEIYDGYFWNRSGAAPGTVISTPISNFIKNDSSKRVLIRMYSTVLSTVSHSLDNVQVEAAIDTIYEPSGFVATNTGIITGYVSDLIGSPSTNLTASDNNKLTIPQPGASTATDFYFTFDNIKTYTGMNTIAIFPEANVSNVALTYSISIYNYNSSSWDTAVSNFTATTGDIEYGYTFNSTTISGFTLSNYISGNEIRIRFLTSAASPARNIVFDRLYMMMGSVNTDTSLCEISWGTGTTTNCSNTRVVAEGKTVAPAGSTWQATSAVEYPSTYYALDNDDDTTNAEYASSQNLSFPITLSSNMTVTAVHWAAKYRSNGTTETADLQIRERSGLTGTSGWANTPPTDTSASTTYVWSDSWVGAEYQAIAPDIVDTVNNTMNLRLRTSASTNTTAGIARDWAFAMMSIRWTEEPNQRTLSRFYPVTGGSMVTGTAVATSNANTASYKSLFGVDANTWLIARNASNGLDLQYQIDNVETYGANKFIITVNDANITTATNFVHQICDWVSTSSVDNAADANCTGGGWRTLTPRKTSHTKTALATVKYQVYDGYFWDTTSSPGTVVSTPLSNFVKSDSTKRVLIRTYSNVASTVQYNVDAVTLEVAIDSVYEPANFTKTNGGSITGNITNLFGDPTSVNVNASDNNRISVPMSAINTATDVYFTFKNVKPYTSANAFLVAPEINVSNVALTYGVYFYNFDTSSWNQVTESNFTATTSDVDYAYAFNSTSTSFTSLDDYISPTGDVRVRFLTNAPGVIYNLVIDRIYLILGSVNSDTSQCEISWGTGTATNCSNTRTIAEGKTSTPTTSTWQATSTLEYPSSYYSLDNDDDAVNAEYAASQNLSMPTTVDINSTITGMHHAIKYRSNATTESMDIQLRDYSANSGTSGWFSTAASDNSANTTYVWADSFVNGLYQTNPYTMVDTTNNLMNLKSRTASSTNTTAGVTRDWDYAMTSLRYVRYQPTITIGTSGTQTANVRVNTSNNFIGSFTAISESGSVNMRQITISEEGTVNANTNLSNLKLYYETTGTCSYDGNETAYNSTGASFGASDTATITGTMPIGTSQICIYAVLDVGAGASASQTIELEITTPSTEVITDSGIPSPDTAVAISGTSTLYTNLDPSNPASLQQKKTDDSNINTGTWINSTSVKFTANLSDSDASDTLYLCVEKKALGVSFSNTEDSCGSGVSYSGSPVAASITISNITAGSEYHWQARTKDAAGAYSSWVSYDTNLESEADFGIDTANPSTGTVNDGTGSDISFNDGTLNSLSANWSGFSDAHSGIALYEVSIGTTPSGTDISNWTNNSTNTSVTLSSLTLHTSQIYYFNIRATDNAGNISSIISSNGQAIAPTLSFGVSPNSINFSNLNNGNNYTDTQTVTLTTSTNAYNGYIVRAYTSGVLTDPLTSSTVSSFNGGTYSAPDGWQSGDRGFGYTSSDTSIQGSNLFNPTTCIGGNSSPCYAPFSQTAPGDIVADNTSTVSGGTGISNESFTITYKVQTDPIQRSGSYTTSIIYDITPIY